MGAGTNRGGLYALHPIHKHCASHDKCRRQIYTNNFSLCSHSWAREVNSKRRNSQTTAWVTWVASLTPSPLTCTGVAARDASSVKRICHNPYTEVHRTHANVFLTTMHTVLEILSLLCLAFHSRFISATLHNQPNPTILVSHSRLHYPTEIKDLRPHNGGATL